MSKFVRLKRFNGKQHLLRSYTVFGIKFLESRGWYEVDDDVAAYLRTVKQIQDSPDAEYSADAFDVVDSMESAKAIDENEKKRAERALAEHANKVSRPQVTQARKKPPTNDLTTADLRQEPIRLAKGDSFDEQPDTFPEDGKPLETAPTRSAAPVVDGAAEDEDDAHERETSPVLPTASTKPAPKAEPRRKSR